MIGWWHLRLCRVGCAILLDTAGTKHGAATVRNLTDANKRVDYYDRVWEVGGWVKLKQENVSNLYSRW